ncbi:hypothetical protein P154DRAFT_621496 [Amniculicola lignicola CBS 123094]|uniref:Phytochrome-like protein n=1 Tax=Amniculicola lignicola CBS 123094 TaxID=1392246 RepID=A0A6A5WMD9_9PLEO|nr:hypothetical protein P154DRAFT_621496 [Amniculicola lignicola CBS 123094]
MPPIVPKFPSELDRGERVYPIRFSIDRPSSDSLTETQGDFTSSVVGSAPLPCPSTLQSDATTVEPSAPPPSELPPAQSVTTPAEPRDPLISETHEYAVSGNSEHGVLHGRRREFTRCEDEPIHIPGAIQSFGILIAIDFVTRGELQVRIASENCEAFCQYSPADLFRLENFLDIFPDEHKSSFEAKAWYMREQYMRTKLDVEPLVFPISIRNPLGKRKRVRCAIHFCGKDHNLLICEFEAKRYLDPQATESDPDMPNTPVVTLGPQLPPTPLAQSTKVQPLHLHRLAHSLHPDERGTAETVSIMAQIQLILNTCQDFEELLDTVVTVVQQLTRFHRVMIYRFDKAFNGEVVAEAAVPEASGDMYKGLHFPASDIPPQARKLYQINKVRLLFDRDMATARLVCRSAEDLAKPLDLTHSYLRAMSPIHIKYLGNMGVRSTASISLEINNSLWGLICCHSYGPTATHVSFSVREVCHWIGLCVSNCIEKLSYSSRLGARKLLETMQVDKDPQSCIAASSSDILRLFNSNSGFMVIQGEARTIGKHNSYLEAILVLRYVHMRAYTTVVATQNITEDHPSFPQPKALKTIAGFLFIPLSGDSDYMLFLRNHQIEEVHWAGNPHAKEQVGNGNAVLEPRGSFQKWTEVVMGACKPWKLDEYQEYATTVKLVYGKFIEVWRANERSIINSKMKRILLLNASHEARTPLNAIINHLEVALENPLDNDTRELLLKSHSASQSLVYIIDDLLNLTRSHDGSFPLLEVGFDIRSALAEALKPLAHHANKKNLDFASHVHPDFPQFVRGDFQRFQQAVVHVVSNAIRCTNSGEVKIEATLVNHNENHYLLEINVRDTGPGIGEDHLDELFQELEQIPSEDSEIARLGNAGRVSRASTPGAKPTVGLGLATVARFIRLRNGLLKMKSTKKEGTIVSLLLPFPRSSEAFHPFQLPTPPEMRSTQSIAQSTPGQPSVGKDSASNHKVGFFDIPIRKPATRGSPPKTPCSSETPAEMHREPMMIIVADDNTINLQILQRRLERMGHEVEMSCGGQQCYDMFIENSTNFHFILMDLDMPLVDGYVATEMIREFERENPQLLSKSAQLHGRTPIFAVSASLKPSHLPKILASGFDGWIIKPVNFKTLGVYLLGAFSVEARKTAAYDPNHFLAGGWLS